MLVIENAARTKLIEATAPLFASKGYNAVSIREIAKAADVNIAAISYYFGGKENLYLAMLEYQFEPIAEALQQINTMPPCSAEERLALYAKTVAKVHRLRPQFIRMFHGELTNPTPAFDTVFRKYISQIFRFLHQTLVDGIADGEFRSDINPGYATVSLAGIINFYFIVRPMANRILEAATVSPEDYIEQAFRIYIEGIRRNEHA